MIKFSWQDGGIVVSHIVEGWKCVVRGGKGTTELLGTQVLSTQLLCLP